MEDPALPLTDEHMITVTLSPQLLRHTVKQQLKRTYTHMTQSFNTGMVSLEFTKQCNVHYHIKTQDEEAQVLAFIDALKLFKFKSNGQSFPVYGFIKVDQTKAKAQIGNYDYLTKQSERSESVLRKLKLSSLYRSLVDYSAKPAKPTKSLNLTQMLNQYDCNLDLMDPFESD